MDEQTTEEVNKDLLLLYGDVFHQLLQSEKFKQFFGLNFDLHKRIDDEEKTISYVLIEVPPQEVMKRMGKQMKDEAANAPQVQLASPSDLKTASRRRPSARRGVRR